VVISYIQNAMLNGHIARQQTIDQRVVSCVADEFKIEFHKKGCMTWCDYYEPDYCESDMECIEPFDDVYDYDEY
jgi:hypothetical protein